MALDTAVIGAGTVSDIHLTGINKNPDTNLVGVCDVDTEQAKDAAAKYDTKAYSDLDQLLSQSIDWLHVCTPVQTHLDIAERAIEAGVPLLIEKPITESVAEVERLIQLSEEHNIPVSPVHQHLFDHEMRTARKLLHSGELGRIRNVNLVHTGHTVPDDVHRGEWVLDLPGGEFEEGLPHPIYQVLRLGGYPRSKSELCVTTAVAGEYDQVFNYDSVGIQYTTSEDVHCSMQMVAGGKPNQSILIHGEKKTVKVDTILQMVHVIDSDYFLSAIGKGKQSLKYAAEYVTGLARNAQLFAEARIKDDWETLSKIDPHYAQFDLTVKALKRGRPMPVSLEEAKWTIETMEAIRESDNNR